MFTEVLILNFISRLELEEDIRTHKGGEES